MQKNTKLGGQTPQSLASSRFSTALAGWVEEASADDAAEVIYALRQDERWMRSAEGMRFQAAAIKKVKGTDWERVLFPKELPACDVEMLKTFRAKHDELYGVMPETYEPTPSRRPGVTQCSICHCDCIDLGGPATVCLGCTNEGREA